MVIYYFTWVLGNLQSTMTELLSRILFCATNDENVTFVAFAETSPNTGGAAQAGLHIGLPIAIVVVLLVVVLVILIIWRQRRKRRKQGQDERNNVQPALIQKNQTGAARSSEEKPMRAAVVWTWFWTPHGQRVILRVHSLGYEAVSVVLSCPALLSWTCSSVPNRLAHESATKPKAVAGPGVYRVNGSLRMLHVSISSDIRCGPAHTGRVSCMQRSASRSVTSCHFLAFKNIRHKSLWCRRWVGKNVPLCGQKSPFSGFAAFVIMLVLSHHCPMNFLNQISRLVKGLLERQSPDWWHLML